MNTNHRSREEHIALAVETFLRCVGGSATISQIRRSLPRHAALTPLDRRPSTTRQGEELWEQQVRNIVCHRDSEGNFVKEGRIRWSPGRLSLPGYGQPDLFN
jgi:hypothetical protein